MGDFFSSHRITRIISVILLLVVFSVSPVIARMSSTNYEITSDVIGSAEGAATSTNYDLLVNMGEGGIGTFNSANWTMKAGFLQTVNSTISISLDSNSVSFGNLAPGGTQTATSEIGVTTDAIGGYTLTAYRSSGGYTQTMRHTNTTTYMSDKTDWDPTAGGGNGNAALWSGDGLGFSVYANDSAEKNTTWWGTGTTESDANNKYAGFPSSSQTIVTTTDYKSGERTTSVGYKLTIPTNQLSGTYSGDVTYIATSNL